MNGLAQRFETSFVDIELPTWSRYVSICTRGKTSCIAQCLGKELATIILH